MEIEEVRHPKDIVNYVLLKVLYYIELFNVKTSIFKRIAFDKVKYVSFPF